MVKLTHIMLKSLYTNMSILDLYKSIKRFYQNVWRVLRYAPTMWRHRPWDYSYVLKLNKQLHEDLYEACYVNGHHLFTKQEAQKLKAVISLYDRLAKDDYSDFTDKYLQDKYGDFRPYNLGSNGSVVRQNDPRTKKYLDDIKRLWKYEGYRRQQDLKLLGKYISKYSHKWWD